MKQTKDMKENVKFPGGSYPPPPPPPPSTEHYVALRAFIDMAESFLNQCNYLGEKKTIDALDYYIYEYKKIMDLRVDDKS